MFKIKPPSQPTPTEVKSAVRDELATMAGDDSIVESHIPPEVEYDVPLEGAESSEDSITNDDRKMERLVADDFPFDESQLAAVDGLIKSDYGCLTGAAGTGKTTTTKKLVDELMNTTTIGRVNMAEYWASDLDDRMAAADDSDEYVIDEKNPIIPTILLCAFTGRATQQIKKNFPLSWHGNIMTIHRALGFVPESYEDWDPEYIDKDTGEKGAYRTKMRFVPTYTAECLMPWDIILIDEAGMLGLDLWHQLLAAAKPGCRIYMVGDINQLPPVHGKSIFGFAMAKWPAYELTHVHRQQGKDNPIVDNAWRIIHGQMPQSEGRFQMIPLKGDANFASRQVRAMVPKLAERGIYDPIRDTIITPINGEHGSRGYALGQLPLNAEFALIFNPKSEHPRYIIDGGRERKQFAVGDKVMATKNDWEAGITNGMTGIITSIEENGAYAGERMRFGLIDEVNARFAEEGGNEEIDILDMDMLNDSLVAIDEGMAQSKVKRERGPSSHIITVRFGSEEHGFEIPFASLSEVGSLMTAYVVTCHKMQGGESPTVVIICHDAHRSMLYREWLYTAVTRASEKCILLYSEVALKTALNKQTIKGRTLKEKVMSFNALMDPSGKFDWVKEVRLPHCESTALTVMDREDTQVVTPARLTTDAERAGGVMALLKSKREKVTENRPIQEIHVHVTHHTTVQADTVVVQPQADSETIVDKGDIEAAKPTPPTQNPLRKLGSPVVPALPAPSSDRGPVAVSQMGAARTAEYLRDQVSQVLLPYYPTQTPEPTPPVEKPKVTGFKFLLAKKAESVA